MSLLPSFTAGALFGTALLCSGVYLPSVITSQFSLTNFHMLQTFLVASSASAIVVRMAQRAGFAACPARSPATAYSKVLGGLLYPYDANVLGGSLIGAGMVLTGACPGTVLVQIGTGMRSGMVVAIGGALGGILFTGFDEWLRQSEAETSNKELKQKSKKTSPSTNAPAPPPTPTLATVLKLTPSTAFLVYETFLLAAIVASTIVVPPSFRGQHWLHPLVGGLVIGVAQAGSVLLTRKTVGVSTAFQDLGRSSWRFLSGGRLYANSVLLTPALAFAGGVVIGSGAVAKSVHFTAPIEQDAGISTLSALLGGVVLVLGAGLAGGCPSGHGISGMATLGISSFVTVAAMFGGGIAVALATGGR